MEQSFRSRLDRTQQVLLWIGVLGICASVAGWIGERRQFFFSYLFGCLFWLGLSLGCFVVTMIHQLTGGRWGYPTRRFLEAGFMTLPLMLVLFIPIFFGLKELYPWARPGEVAVEKVLQGRHGYQNAGGFIIRTLFVFGIWWWMIYCLRKWSLAQDQTTDAAPTRKARRLSGPGIVLFSLLGTFACVDWIMSLEPKWYSTMFGVIVLIGQILVAYAFSLILLTLFRRQPSMAVSVTKTHYHHLGNLLLTFVLFWTYISFGQLLIIYSGDLPHEIDWYLHRIAGDWKWLISALALFHFFVPFLLLLLRGIKRHVAPLTTVAILLFITQIADTYWLVMPTLHQHGISLSWLDFATPIGIGGLWLAYFLSRLKRADLLPREDPGMQFAFRYEH